MRPTLYIIRSHFKHPEIFDQWLAGYTERIIRETLAKEHSQQQ